MVAVLKTAKKSHAQWSASAAHRNMPCPGNLALATGVTPAPESWYAAYGTACHTLVEICLTDEVEPLSMIDTLIETESFTIPVDDEMVACADVYVGYIRSQLFDGAQLIGNEINLALDGLDLAMPAGGTADTVLYFSDTKLLEVVDLKTGRGILIEASTPQTRVYGIGALFECAGLPVEQVRSTIIQPRAPHRDGRIRSETLPVMELIDWSTDLVDAVNNARTAFDLYAKAKGNSVMLDDWAERWLHTGDHCQFCPSAGGCPKLRREAFDVAGVWFDDGEPKVKSNAMAENSLAVVERDLGLLEILEEWIRARRALAHEMALQGIEFRDWMLVEKLGNRAFVGETWEDKVKALRSRLTLSDDQLFDKRLKSPAGLERAIGKANVRDYLADLIIKPVSGTDLVRKSKSNVKRYAAQTTAERHFQKPNETVRKDH